MATLAPSSAASTTWSGMCARQHVIFIIGVIVGARVGAEPRRGGDARHVGQPLERPGKRAVGRRAAAHLGDAHDDRLPHGGVCAARALLRIALGRLHAEGDAPARAEGDAPARAEGSACIRWYQAGLYSYSYSSCTRPTSRPDTSYQVSSDTVLVVFAYQTYAGVRMCACFDKRVLAR